jgi:hypothetical protein
LREEYTRLKIDILTPSIPIGTGQHIQILHFFLRIKFLFGWWLTFAQFISKIDSHLGFSATLEKMKPCILLVLSKIGSDAEFGTVQTA